MEMELRGVSLRGAGVELRVGARGCELGVGTGGCRQRSAIRCFHCKDDKIENRVNKDG